MFLQILVQLDLSSMESVQKCAKDIKKKVSKIDILINNAGVMLSPPTIERTEDGFEKILATNHLGHFVLTKLLLSHIKKGSLNRYNLILIIIH